MDIEEAFEILGLPIGTSKKEIDSQYQKLSFQLHPDLKGGNKDKMTILNLAKEYIDENYSDSNLGAIVLANERAMAKFNQLYGKIENESIKKRVVLKQKNEYTKLRDLGTFTFSLSTGLLFIQDKIPILLFNETTDFNNKISYWLLLSGMSFVALSYYCNSRTKYVEDSLEELDKHLSSKSNYFKMFRELIIGCNSKTMSGNVQRDETEIKHCINVHQNKTEFRISHLIRMIGIEEFTKLFIFKGIELGVIDEHIKNKPEELFIKYSLSSDFSVEL